MGSLPSKEPSNRPLCMRCPLASVGATPFKACLESSGIHAASVGVRRDHSLRNRISNHPLYLYYYVLAAPVGAGRDLSLRSNLRSIRRILCRFWRCPLASVWRDPFEAPFESSAIHIMYVWVSVGARLDLSLRNILRIIHHVHTYAKVAT